MTEENENILKKIIRHFSLRILFVLGLVSGTQAYAAGNHEVFVNSLGFSVASGDSNIQLSPGFNYGLLPWLSAGANVTFHSSSYILTSITRLTILFGPTVNFGGGNINDSYFVFMGGALKTGSASQDGTTIQSTASGGVVTATGGSAVNDPNGFGFALFVGKRFPIAGSISYRPSIGMMATGSIGFTINAFAASITL